MTKRIHYWLFGMGLVLILAGITVVVRLDTSSAASIHSDRLRLAQVISDLQGCFCHPVSEQQPILAHSLNHAAFLGTHPSSQPEFVQREVVETRLVSAGQRILALPDGPRESARNVSADFLRIYDQMRGGAATVESLAALDQLEFWLTTLEHQAQTDRWKSASPPPSLPDGSAWQTISSMSPHDSAAFPWAGDILPAIVHVSVRVVDDHRDLRCPDAVYGVHRRGPPVGAPYAMV